MNYSKAAKQSKNQVITTRVLKPPSHTQSSTRVGSYERKLIPIKEETIEEKIERLQKEVNKHESPFKWRPVDYRPVSEPETIIRRLKEKDKELKDERKFQWRNFIFHLVIGYELYRAKRVAEALEEICSLEKELYSPRNRHEFFFTSVEAALTHIIVTSKAFLYLELGLVREAAQAIERIEPVKTMSRQHKASVHGIKAAMFMEYGHQGNKNALIEIEEALKMDRTVAEWHFLLAKCLGRIRRYSKCYDLVDYIEVKALNKAVDLDEKNASYNAFLGQTLIEQAYRKYMKFHPKSCTEEHKKLLRIYRAGIYRLKDAAALRPNCPHILIRIARGMINVPVEMKELKYTHDIIEKALELAPENIMVHHVKGLYLERYDVKLELALESYQKAAAGGNFGAAMDYLKLNYKLNNQNVDCIKELEMMAQTFAEPVRRQEIYAQAGSFMLFNQNNFIEAFKYYNKVIKIDQDSYALNYHKPMFIRMKNPVNMFHVLNHELDKNTKWESFSPEEKEILKFFKCKTMSYCNKAKKEAKILSVEEILQMAREHLKRDAYCKEKRERNREKNKKKCEKWLGKKNKGYQGRNKKNKEESKTSVSNNENEILSYKLMKLNLGNKADDKVRGRRRDVSVSSVDSDYVRDSTIFGERKLLRWDSDRSVSGDEVNFTEPHDKFLKAGLIRSRSRSRESDVSSLSSSLSNLTIERKLPEQSQLTVKNVRQFDVVNSSLTRSMSQMSISSEASSSNTISVMERVKQSYKMLSYKNEDMKKYGSTQSLNLHPEGKKRNKNMQFKKQHKSDSVQSLNIQEGNRKLPDFKPNFHSNFGSPQSISFLPSFARKGSEIEDDKH